MSRSPLLHPARLAGASLLRLQSDERLAELAAAGHEAAFDAIVDRYRTPLTRYCGGIVGPSRAEDAVQQALINAHDALKRTDEVRHLRSWMYRIAHNAALNVLRAVRDDVSLDGAGAAALAEAESVGPAEALERSERLRATVEALRGLPERQRAALVLRELEGRSHEEIAETLGVTKGSARQHLMRARTAMRAAVTAVTPYPLIVRLAEALTTPGSAGWTDAAAGAGAGATLAKLTAGVVATGALVGGAVGTQRVVHHHGNAAQAAEERATEAKKPLVRGATIGLPPAVAGGAGAAGAGPSGGGAAGGGSGGKPSQRRTDGSGSSDGSGTSGSSRDGSSGSGRGSGDSGGRGSSGRGSPGKDSGGGDRSSGGKGSSNSGGSGGKDSGGSGSSGKHSGAGGDDGSRSGGSADTSSGSTSHGGRQQSDDATDGGSGGDATPFGKATTTTSPGSGSGSSGSGSSSGGISGGGGDLSGGGSDDPSGLPGSGSDGG
jgi:RNA polymerase sigma factor (sigma-70 family)